MSAESDYPEAGDYIRTYARENSLEEYLSHDQVRKGGCGYSDYCQH